MSATQLVKIKKGLNLPITGQPEQIVSDSPEVRSVAVIGPDYAGMRPTMAVNVGDQVRLGQVLFTDKKNDGVNFVAPGSGKVTAINRGEKRVLLSVVIELDGSDSAESFQSYSSSELTTVGFEAAQKNLVDSGLWTAFRTRPYSRSPKLGSKPHSIFITAIDTGPLAADPTIVINENQTDFENGLKVLKNLTDGAIYLCQAPEVHLPGAHLDFISPVAFDGPHPAGLAGTHIHFLDPVSTKKTVWTIGYQDIIAIGKLFTTGQLWTERVIALAGPSVSKPRLVRTRIGANISDIVRDAIKDGTHRIVSGSILNGHHAKDALDYLGRFHNQVSAIEEGTKREFLGWQMPGFDKYSMKNIYAGHTMPWKKFALTTSTGGSKRSMVPVGAYEDVMPLDIIPTFLLRSLIVGDTEQAQLLGCLELDEEDLGLCTFVCPGKYNYGPILRDNLTRIEKEG